jgi:hypothetical protein
MADIKYFTYYNGHADLDYSLWLTIGTYAESKLEAEKIFKDVLMEPDIKQVPENEKDEHRNRFRLEFVSERELEDGEEPKRIVYGKAPTGYTWKHSF